MIKQETYQSFEIGSDRKLSPAQKQALVREFERPSEAAPQNSLSGRVQPHKTLIEGIGRVVVKHYFRGGLLYNVNRRTYLKTGRPRNVEEFETIGLVRSAGVTTPEPVAYAYRTKGYILYHAWLVSKEIPASLTFAKLCRRDPCLAERLLSEICGQVKLLIKNGIMHVDLHPGNVLVDQGQRVYLIDFDRAKKGIKNKKRLAEHYLNRWRRAVSKHGLPGFMHNLCLN